MTPRQFVLRFLGLCSFVLVVIGAFNRIVDPFWYYRDSEIQGFNTVKTKFRRFEREVKPALVQRDKPEAIILGSSFSEIGLNPENPYFSGDGRFKTMNFGLAAAPWQMVYCEFQFALNHAPIKRALIGIHPEALPTPDCAKEYPGIGQISHTELLLSVTALGASIATVTEQKKRPPSHTRAGMYFYDRDRPGIVQRFKYHFGLTTKKNPDCLKTAAANPPVPPLGDFAKLDLSGFKNLVQAAQRHQVELVFYLYPRHAYSLELDQQCGSQTDRWRNMKQLAWVNEHELSRPVPIWEFFDYNPITAEPIGPNTVFWQDPEHFNFEMGDQMLAEMFDGPVGEVKLGRPLQLPQLDADYLQFQQRRSNYLQQHPEFQSVLQKLLF